MTIVFLNFCAGGYLSTTAIERRVIECVLSSLLLYVCTFQGGLVEKMFSKPWNVKLGEMTMYFFLIHYPVKIYLKLLIEKINPEKNMRNALIEIIILLTFTAICSYLVAKFEKRKKRVK